MTISVSLAIKEVLNSRGYYLNQSLHDLESVGKAVVGHEHFHILQISFQPPNIGFDMIDEGQARFSQTAHVPDIEADESSLWYAADAAGVNSYVQYPSESLCTSAPTLKGPNDAVSSLDPGRGVASQGYMFALYWGYLYAHDGGILTIKKVLDLFDGGCPPEDITRALQARANETTVQHVNFSSSLVDFAVAMYTKNFSWPAANGGDNYSFGGFLDAAARATQPMNQSKKHHVGGWAINYTELPTNVNFTVNQTLGNASHWNTQILLTHPNGTVEVRGFAPTEVIALSGTAYSKATYCAVHLHDAWEGFDLTLSWAA